MIIIRIIHEPALISSHRTTVTRMIKTPDFDKALSKDLAIRAAAEEAIKEFVSAAPWDKKA